MAIKGNNDVLSLQARPHIKIFSGQSDTVQALSGTFTPAQMRKAYGIDQIMFGEIVGDGSGQTVAVVDAYLYTNAHTDFNTFCSQYSLPSTGLTTMTQQDLLNDSSGTPPTDQGWNLEAALDVQQIRAIAPGANIILIQAASASFGDLFACVQGAALISGVCAVSMSWGVDTFSSEADYDFIFASPDGHQGVTFCASTGDNGEPGGYPADSVNVVAVGGTSLFTDGSGNWSSESGWNGSGGSVSPYETQPSYQTGVVTQSVSHRCQPDVAFDADPATGVLVYCNSGSHNGWVQVGGTSLACPCWAALITIANQGRAINGLGTLNGLTQTLPILYSMTYSNFHDITTGNNGFAARTGYDLVTGLGSPKTNLVIAALSISSAAGASANGISNASASGRIGYRVSNNVTVNAISASFTDNSPVSAGIAMNFTDTSVGAANWSWNFGDDIGTSTTRNPSYTYTNPGVYTVGLSINGGFASINNSVTVNVSDSYIWQEVDLSSVFNVIGIVPAGDGGETNSGLDGSTGINTPPTSGSSTLNGTSLQNSFPNPITIGGVNFNLNYNNEMNTIYCNGQVIPLSGACFDYIYLLGLGVNEGTSGGYATFTVTYSDSTTSDVQLQVSDWFTRSNNYANETIALGGDDSIIRSDSVGPIYIFKYTLAIDRTKEAVSLTLPVYNKIDIFAISEASLVSTPKMWLSGDSLEALVGLNDGQQVSAWNDISGHANDALQLTSGLQPTFHTNVINGFPAIRFTGSSLSGHQYNTGKYLTRNLPVTGNYSVMAVVRQSSPTGKFSVAVSWGGSGGGANFWTGYIPDDSPTAYPGHFIPASDSSNDIYSSPVDDTNWHISEGIFNGTHLSGWSSSIDGTGAGVGASGNHNGSSSTLAGSTLTIGCYKDNSLFWNGDIAEVIVFNVALSDSDRQVVESYLIHKYNLQNQNEIQQVTFSATPTGGTYTITANGQTTSNIDYATDKTNIQSYINTAFEANNASVS